MQIVIVDDHPLIRTGIRSQLEGAGHHIVGEAETLAHARMLIATSDFDLAVIDLSLPDGNGLELVEPEHKYLVLTLGEDPRSLEAAYEKGAAAYVLKSQPTRYLLTIIEQIEKGFRPFRKPDVRKNRFGLTEREIEVLEVLSSGAQSAEIASHLFLTVSTVKTHLAAINRKLGVQNRTAAVSAAREAGII